MIHGSWFMAQGAPLRPAAGLAPWAMRHEPSALSLSHTPLPWTIPSTMHHENSINYGISYGNSQIDWSGTIDNSNRIFFSRISTSQKLTKSQTILDHFPFASFHWFSVVVSPCASSPFVHLFAPISAFKTSQGRADKIYAPSAIAIVPIF